MENRIAQPHNGSGKLGGWVNPDDIQFCIEIAKVYGCKPLETDVWNFYKFLYCRAVKPKFRDLSSYENDHRG